VSGGSHENSILIIRMIEYMSAADAKKLEIAVIVTLTPSPFGWMVQKRFRHFPYL
jgi:hypothetical protein